MSLGYVSPIARGRALHLAPVYLMTDDLEDETPEPRNDVPENQDTGTPDPNFPDEDDASVAHEPVTEGDQ